MLIIKGIPHHHIYCQKLFILISTEHSNASLIFILKYCSAKMATYCRAAFLIVITLVLINEI